MTALLLQTAPTDTFSFSCFKTGLNKIIDQFEKQCFVVEEHQSNQDNSKVIEFKLSTDKAKIHVCFKQHGINSSDNLKTGFYNGDIGDVDSLDKQVKKIISSDLVQSLKQYLLSTWIVMDGNAVIDSCLDDEYGYFSIYNFTDKSTLFLTISE